MKLTSEKIDHISGIAYQLFRERPGYSDDEFPMYSFERFARVAIAGVLKRCAELGMDEHEAVEFLRSKGPRHFLDNYSDEIEDDIRDTLRTFNILAYLEK